VLPSILLEAFASGSEEAYQRTLLRLLAKTNDGHAVLLAGADNRPPSGECRATAIVRAIEASHIVVAASVDSGLKPGDRVVSVGGEPVSKLMIDWLPYYAASSPSARLNQLSMNITRGDCEVAVVTVARDGEELSVESPRVSTPLSRELLSRELPGPAFRLLAGNIAYLKLSQSRASDIAGYLDAASQSGGLIVDLRGYPKEFVVFELGGRLVDLPTPFAKFSVPSVDEPGAFFFTQPVELRPQSPNFAGRVAVLIDESTISQAEYTAMALRAAGATLVGSSSAGTDGNVSRVELPGGLKFMFSGIGVYYPDGKTTQGVGLVPDVLVAPSHEGVHDCRDEVLEAAVLYLAGTSTPKEKSVSVCRTLDAPGR
jgi:C-terminal processing protease CtpA/Prc